MKHTFHVIALPNTQTTKAYSSCAYTQKVIKFCRMMKDMGNTVYLYASEDNDAPCDELITCITKKEQLKTLDADHYVKVSFDTNKPIWQVFFYRAINEIQKRKKDHDFLCLSMGNQREISNVVGDGMAIVEIGIGYSSVFAPYKVFESYSWMHSVYAQYQDAGAADGKFYDTVIPNFFDIDDFVYKSKKQDYLLFVGRMIQRKGVKIIEEIANRTKKHTIMAGMGAKQHGNIITCQDITIQSDYIEYVGEVGPEKRSELMGNARALICPTLYLEPFGGVNVEAQLCGTPVISTDWGGFTETIEDGVTGFRCHTLKEFCDATDNVKKLDYKYIRNRAVKNYSLQNIAIKYQNYFDRVYQVFDKGWYSN